MKIGLLSDTHSHLDERFFNFFKDCDEIWHAGDIGTEEIIDRLKAFKPLVIIYGNIDGGKLRQICQADEYFEREGCKIFMTHIGGYPGRYNQETLQKIKNYRPDIFVCGHSHILKVMYDKTYNLLHINPGAAGIHGWHKVRTAVRFEIMDGKPQKMEIFELPRTDSGRFSSAPLDEEH
jgi:putative phosphoesterase